jgi:excinuclease UvrABC helicase subunit UvrB
MLPHTMYRGSFFIHSSPLIATIEQIEQPLCAKIGRDITEESVYIYLTINLLRNNIDVTKISYICDVVVFDVVY